MTSSRRTHKSMFGFTFLCAAAATLLATGAPRAAVVGTVAPNEAKIFSGSAGTFSMSLTATENVEGINGEVVFDPAIFSTPSVAVALGQAGDVIAMGNEVSPGLYRFILYSTTATSLNIGAPVLQFSFTVRPEVNLQQNPSFSFTMELSAAASVSGPEPTNVTSVDPVDFQPFSTVVSPNSPTITQHPKSQVTNPNRMVSFNSEATGSGALTYQWLKNGADLGGETGASYTIASATTADDGLYSNRIADQVGTVFTNEASLTVVAQELPNLAEIVGHNIPSLMGPGLSEEITVTVRNTSMLTWSETQTFGLAVANDPANLFGGVTRLPLGSFDVVAQEGGEFTFTGTITAPTEPGTVTLTLQMTEEAFAGPFGGVLTHSIVVGPTLISDFAGGNDALGWVSEIIQFPNLNNETSVASGSSGLCISVPDTGDNAVVWFSPVRHIELIPNTAYRIRFSVTIDQTASNEQPIWNIIWSNLQNFRISWGGERWFFDNTGGANGIGQVGRQGFNEFDVWMAPSAVSTMQWNGDIDPADGAFSPSNDPFNDFTIGFRVLDLDAAPLLSEVDDGTICLQQMQIDAVPMGALQPDGPPIYGSTTGLPPSFGVVFNTPETLVDTSAGTIRIALDEVPFSPPSPIPALGRAFVGFSDPNLGGLPALYPIPWQDNELLRISAQISDSSGATTDFQPVDIIALGWDTATNELGGTDFITSGQEGFFNRSASPRAVSATGASPQTYTSFFWTHHSTDVDPVALPGATNLRAIADFFNRDDIAGLLGQGNLSDELELHSFAVERMVLPDGFTAPSDQ